MGSLRATLAVAGAVLAVIALGVWGGVKFFCWLWPGAPLIESTCDKDIGPMIIVVTACCAVVLVFAIVADQRQRRGRSG